MATGESSLQYTFQVGDTKWSCPASATVDWRLVQDLRSMYDDLATQVVPLHEQYCSEPTVMDKIVLYAQTFPNAAPRKMEHGSNLTPEELAFFGDFRKLDLGALKSYAVEIQKLLLAAKFLQYAALEDACCCAIAAILKASKSFVCAEAPTEADVVRALFDLPDDFTPEEREQIVRDAKWLDEYFPDQCEQDVDLF